MAVKRRQEKKHYTEMLDEAPKIRCRYCDSKDTCKRREQKESYENLGVITKCLLSPNRPGKKPKR